MGFRRAHDLIRRSAPKWQGGKVVSVSEVAATFQASIQPATIRDYDENTNLPAGFDLNRTIRIYTSERLAIPDSDLQIPGDLVSYRGKQYLVFDEAIWDAMGSNIDHFKYLAFMESPS